MALPAAVASSGCNTIVSFWHFANKLRAGHGLEPLPVEAAAELFCRGLSPFGPYWDHVLGYWRAHLAPPQQVLFVIL